VTARPARTLILIAALTLPGATAGAPGAKRAKVAQVPACRTGEKTVFLCRSAGKIAAICSDSGRLSYRYGPRGRPEIEISSDGRDGKAFKSGGVGGGGGSFTNLRFLAGAFSYIATSGEAGQLTDIQGKRWSRVTVLKGQETVASHECSNVNSQTSMMDADLPMDAEEFTAWY
jgi:hypothetical protein